MFSVPFAELSLLLAPMLIAASTRTAAEKNFVVFIVFCFVVFIVFCFVPLLVLLRNEKGSRRDGLLFMTVFQGDAETNSKGTTAVEKFWWKKHPQVTFPYVIFLYLFILFFVKWNHFTGLFSV